MEKNKKNDRMETLAHRFKTGTITPGERTEFEQWYQSFDDSVFQHRDAANPDVAKLRMQRYVWDRMNETPIKNVASSRLLRMRRLPYVGIAAAMLIFALFAGWWISSERLMPGDLKEGGSRFAYLESLEAIKPGGNRAVLTLSDGRIVELSTDQDEIIIGDGVRYQDGSSVAGSVDDAMFMSITTPNGGTYQVTLSDGSKVWLNAASTLKYPSRFEGDSRTVELTGEAFFEVVKRRSGAGESKNLPFMVQTKGQVVEVLGTDFNVSAYEEENDARTTLVEGSVEVRTTGALHKKELVRLVPGRQAVLSADGKIQVATVDVGHYTAWKEGLISLDHTDLHSLIRQIERWYDVQFEFPSGTPQQIKLSGALQRNAKLAEILDILALNLDIHFTIEGRRIIGNK